MLNGIVEQNHKAISSLSFCVTFLFIPSLQKQGERGEGQERKKRVEEEKCKEYLKKKIAKENGTEIELPINLMVAESHQSDFTNFEI